MGGGDLNSKKSWHPNNLKNQEQVWKAEQAAAQEKKRIEQLRHEKAQEKDRAELNEIAKRTAGASSDDRLSWMYEKPDKKGNQEDYLLGKTVDAKYDESDKPKQHEIPAVSRRVVGSSMLPPGSIDVQVDLSRKLKEDPLLLIKERERAARAALLNNPLQRKKLTELLRKEQDQKKDKKPKKKSSNLDSQLAAKLSALSGGKEINIAALLDSDDSSDSSSDDADRKRKKKKKKSKKNKKNKTKSSSGDSTEEDSRPNHKSTTEKGSGYKNSKSFDSESDDTNKERRSRKEAQPRYVRDENTKKTKSRHSPGHEKNLKTDASPPKRKRARSPTEREYRNRDCPSPKYRNRRESSHRERGRSRDRGQSRETGTKEKYRSGEASNANKRGGESKRGGLSEAERAARLSEMARAGAEHERSRGERVARHRAAAAAADAAAPVRRQQITAGALPATLEARIHSNRHNIQRNERHMNEHFARR